MEAQVSEVKRIMVGFSGGKYTSLIALTLFLPPISQYPCS